MLNIEFFCSLVRLNNRMDEMNFKECVEMIRSKDSMTYEDGYHWLQGHLDNHLDDLILLMQRENDPSMRGRFLELIGDSKNPTVIPVLEVELRNESSEVRSWAYSSLCYFENPVAESLAMKFRAENPDEEFL